MKGIEIGKFNVMSFIQVLIAVIAAVLLLKWLTKDKVTATGEIQTVWSPGKNASASVPSLSSLVKKPGEAA